MLDRLFVFCRIIFIFYGKKMKQRGEQLQTILYCFILPHQPFCELKPKEKTPVSKCLLLPILGTWDHYNTIFDENFLIFSKIASYLLYKFPSDVATDGKSAIANMG